MRPGLPLVLDAELFTHAVAAASATRDRSRSAESRQRAADDRQRAADDRDAATLQAAAAATEEKELREALTTRLLIGQAEGLPMAAHHLDEQAAFALLVNCRNTAT
jgi:hypothetical protein